MPTDVRSRFFDVSSLLSDPLVPTMTLSVASLLAVTPVVFVILSRAGVTTEKLDRELWDRWRSWLILATLMILPVLLGGGTVVLAVGLLSVLCYREFALATGLFRERLISAVVVLGILLLTFAALDNWYGFFVALWPLTVGVIAAVAILADRPLGYVQRVGLGVLGFMLCGACLCHLGFIGNERRYREILFWIVLCVELNDVFAFVCGKSLGRHKLAPNTSPNKTVEGSVGAIVLTTTLAACVGYFVFKGTVLAQIHHLILMGLIMSVVGQLGDLLLSSIKRDIGIKDMGNTFPGHGGVLDRFNSLLLVSPALFHYIGYYQGIGMDQPTHLILGQ